MDRALTEGLLRALQDVAVIRKDLVRLAAVTCPMSSLAMLGVLSRTGGIRVGQLAEWLHVDISVASRQLAQLEGAGYVSRRPDPDDGRAHLVELTPLGRQELSSIQASVADRFEAALSEWTDDEVAVLTRQLQRLRFDLQPALAPTAAAAMG